MMRFLARPLRRVLISLTEMENKERRSRLGAPRGMTPVSGETGHGRLGGRIVEGGGHLIPSLVTEREPTKEEVKDGEEKGSIIRNATALEETEGQATQSTVGG